MNKSRPLQFLLLCQSPMLALIWACCALICFPMRLHGQVMETTWLQKPGFLVATNDPQMRGGGRGSSLDWSSLTGTTNHAPHNVLVADDFQGLRPVLRVRWWGSYPIGLEPTSTNSPFEDCYVLSFFGRSSQTNALTPGYQRGVYVAPVSVVQRIQTPFVNSDGNRIYQYDVLLKQARLDGIIGTAARAYGFIPETNRTYWISIAALVGLQLTPQTDQAGWPTNWVQQTTGKRATNDFWYWQSSPDQWGGASVSTTASLSGTSWRFTAGNWQTNPPVQGDLGQAFQLIGGCSGEDPRVVSLTAQCGSPLVTLVFDQRLDPTSAQDPFNFPINGVVPDVLLLNSERDVVQLLHYALRPGTNVLELNNFINECGIAISYTNISFEVSCPLEPPTPPVLFMMPVPRLNAVLLSWHNPAYQLETKTNLKHNTVWTQLARQSPFSVELKLQQFFRLAPLTP